MIHRRTVLIAVAVLLAVGGAVLLLIQSSNDTGSVSAPPRSSRPNTSKTDLEKSQEITVTGVLDCLQPQGDGPHTMECAFGLTTDDGTVYALGSDDPMLIGTVPTGTRVEVTGALQKVPNEKYGTTGTVEVRTIKQL